MAVQRTTITVLKTGLPLAGTEVIVGGVTGTALVTDEDGLVQFGLEEGYVAYVHALVTTSPDVSVVAFLRLQAGEVHTIEIP